MTYHTDPAAAFTGRLVNTDHRAHVPVHPTREASGHLPDPRNPNGPRWAITPPEYPPGVSVRFIGHLTDVELARDDAPRTGDWYGWRSRRMNEPGDWAAAVISSSTGQVLETFSTLPAAMMQAQRWNTEPSRRWAALAAALPADPERYERPRGWGRQYLVAGVVAMALAALVAAYAALLPW